MIALAVCGNLEWTLCEIYYYPSFTYSDWIFWYLILTCLRDIVKNLLYDLVSGTLLLVVTCQPSTSLWSNAGVSVALPYYILSLSLNIILTFLIVLRLVLHRRRFRVALGKDHAEPYTSLAAFIIESAAPYAILSAIYLVLVAINNPIQQIFLGILSGAQVTS